MSFDKRSFASAETLPVKVIIHQKLWRNVIENGKITPIHLQLNPTNTCSFNCGFCSCRNRDKSLELDIHKLMRFMQVFKLLGGTSVTLTGGGEVGCYSHLTEMIDGIYDLGIQQGLVTNGTQWQNFNKAQHFEDLVWIRISASDELPQQLKRLKTRFSDWLANIHQQVMAHPKIDWSFSYVLTENPDIEVLRLIILFANSHKFTHIRVVNNIFNADKLVAITNEVRNVIRNMGIDDSLVNWQTRNVYVKGRKNCWISLAKPVLAADEHLYGCCGSQYCIDPPTYDYEKAVCLGHMDELPKIIANQQHINGAVCAVCYYDQYNEAFDAGLNNHKIKHKEFI